MLCYSCHGPLLQGTPHSPSVLQRCARAVHLVSLSAFDRGCMLSVEDQREGLLLQLTRTHCLLLPGRAVSVEGFDIRWHRVLPSCWNSLEHRESCPFRHRAGRGTGRQPCLPFTFRGPGCIGEMLGDSGQAGANCR